MKERKYLEQADELMKRITKGAFLTVKEGDRVNTMTIGWATIGFVWKKEIFMVAVRDSRYTFQLIDNTDNFTVTIPTGNAGKEALAFCGTKSGRDHDKLAACGLALNQGQKVASPVIALPGVHYECKIIYKSAMNPAFLDPAADDKLYPQKDYHTLYFGEIVACYETE